ncbi:MAG: hypothetical protein WCP01_17210 [Methylococcaceae bacterium]
MNLKTKKLTAAILTLLTLDISVAEAAREGPQGPQGKQGVMGSPGVAGVAGARGADGVAGARGVAGAPGATGPVGNTGVAGAPGIQGLPGALGIQGLPGAPGIQGLPGAGGARGADGQQGPQGQSAPSHFVGEQYQGGIIIWTDREGQHGLIGSMVNQSSGIPWSSAGFNKLTGTSGDGIGAGAMNTAMIVATQIGDSTQPNFAALSAANYSANEFGQPCGNQAQICYGDWYLPSNIELTKLYENGDRLQLIGGSYWSSTESGASGTLSVGQTLLKTEQHSVRAIRSF